MATGTIQKASNIVLAKEVGSGSSTTYTTEANHVYLLVCSHPYNAAYVAVIAGWSSGSTRITGLNSAQNVTASMSGLVLTVSVTSGTFWVRLFDLGSNT